MHRVYKRRFKVPKEPKYGSINKAFTETELQLFLRAVGSEKFRLLFEYQAYLGLRVGLAAFLAFLPFLAILCFLRLCTCIPCSIA